MLYKSDFFGSEYDIDEVYYIPNMKQNYKYMTSNLSYGQLVDVICGRDEKLVFVWKKTRETKQLYDMWCKHLL